MIPVLSLVESSDGFSGSSSKMVKRESSSSSYRI